MTENVVDTQLVTRTVPWMSHGGGNFDGTVKTAAEAAEIGHLNFEVDILPVAYHSAPDVNGDVDWDMLNAINPITHRRAVVARDNGDFMGFVSSKVYSPLQYGEAFNFMDTISPDYVAAGTLRGRRQGYMVVKCNIDIKVLNGEDKHDMFAVLRTSHDCSRGVEVSAMPLRYRCINQITLKSFMKGVDYRWSIKHNTSMHAKLAEAQHSLKKLEAYSKRFCEIAEKLAEKQVSADAGRKMIEYVIPAPAGKTDRTHDQWRDRITRIEDLWMNSPTVAYAGTAWGLVNAVSEYFDWYRIGGTPESRFLNALEGETHKKINKITGILLSNA